MLDHLYREEEAACFFQSVSIYLPILATGGVKKCLN